MAERTVIRKPVGMPKASDCADLQRLARGVAKTNEHLDDPLAPRSHCSFASFCHMNARFNCGLIYKFPRWVVARNRRERNYR
ncbi:MULTISPECIES: hypothetical protein [unclassified Ensifer]|uniref:hypothetical protein n=1 Tax=unclassified Ensifer TaxID=2633371 RepID=UPI00111202D7|nr:MULTISPECIES: hypothetical protein [unclassified Ensifer]